MNKLVGNPLLEREGERKGERERERREGSRGERERLGIPHNTFC